jgi:hypothetical protein
VPIQEEFRNYVESLLQALRDASSRVGAFEDSETDSLYDIAQVIHFYVVAQGLLDKTPSNPPELRSIAQSIRGLPLVRRIIADHPRIQSVDNPVEMGDLDALEFKLREMLEYVPEPTSPTTTQPSPPRKSRGPRPDMTKHESIANAVRPYGEDWKQENNLEDIAKKLDREKVPVTKTWPNRKPAGARTWKTALMSFPQDVVKTIAYSLQMTHKKNQSP